MAFCTQLWTQPLLFIPYERPDGSSKSEFDAWYETAKTDPGRIYKDLEKDLTNQTLVWNSLLLLVKRTAREWDGSSAADQALNLKDLKADPILYRFFSIYRDNVSRLIPVEHMRPQ